MVKKLACLLAALGMVVVLAACGSSSGSSSSGSNSSAGSQAAEGTENAAATSGDGEYVELMGDSKYSTPTLEPAAKAEKEGEEFADPKPAKLPEVTVGYLNFAKAAESGIRAEYEFNEAAKVLGWKVISCDGGGTPTGYTNCMNTLLNQNVEAILTGAVEPAVISAEIKQAHAKDIPVLSGGAEVELGEYDGTFYPLDEEATKLNTEFLLEEFKELDGKKEVAIHTFPLTFVKNRAAGIKKALKGNPEIEIVAEDPIETADVVGSAKKVTETEITQFPNLAAIIDPFDSGITGSAQAIATKLPGKSFPEAPLLIGYHALLGSQAYMRTEPPLISAIADNNYVSSSWVAADQLAEYFARGTQITKEPEPDYGIDYTSNQLVTPESLLAEERYPPDKSNYWAFFKGKWAKEFGIE